MSVLCKYAIAALFAYFAKVCILHIFRRKLATYSTKVLIFFVHFPWSDSAYFVLLRSAYSIFEKNCRIKPTCLVKAAKDFYSDAQCYVIVGDWPL